MGLRQLRNSCPPISESFPCWYLKCRPRSCHCGGSGDDRSHLGLFSSKICDNQEQEDPETSPVMTRGRVRRVTGRGSSGRGRVGGRKFITGIKIPEGGIPNLVNKKSAVDERTTGLSTTI